MRVFLEFALFEHFGFVDIIEPVDVLTFLVFNNKGSEFDDDHLTDACDPTRWIVIHILDTSLDVLIVSEVIVLRSIE